MPFKGIVYLVLALIMNKGRVKYRQKKIEAYFASIKMFGIN
jgi:uncharacterized membrane protein SirB2